MDLFDYMRASTQEQESPLASRMRPTTLDEVVGQSLVPSFFTVRRGPERQRWPR